METKSPLERLKKQGLSVYAIAKRINVSYNRAHLWDHCYGKPNLANQAKLKALEVELESQAKP